MVTPLSSKLKTQNLSYALEQLDSIAFRQGHDRLLPVGGVAILHTTPPHLTAHIHRMHFRHRDVEDLFDRVLDLGLVGVAIDLERILVEHHQVRILFGDQRSQNNLMRVHHASSSAAPLASAALLPWPR